MIEIMHYGKNHIAFYSSIDAKIGDPVLSENIVLLDGTKPEDDDLILCGTCGKNLGTPDLIPGNRIDNRKTGA